MQNNPNSTPSSRVKLKAITLSHLLLSVLVAALTAAGDSAFQYIQTNATHFSATQLIGAVLFSFFGALGTGVVSLENNPDVQDAIDGALARHTQSLLQVINQHAALTNQVLGAIHLLTSQPIQPPQPPVTVHVTTAPANVVQASDSASASAPEQLTQATPPVQQQPAPQLPFPQAPQQPQIPPVFNLPTISSMLPAVQPGTRQ